MEGYIVEIGTLLDENSILFEDYNTVYGGEYGFYVEEIYKVDTLQKAKNNVLDYIETGHNNVYGIVTKIDNADDIDLDTYLVNQHNYNLDNIVFSAAMINNEPKIDFLKIDINIEKVKNSLREIEQN